MNNENNPLALDVSKIESAVLRRLINEVQSAQKAGDVEAYNRIHNRHNRTNMPIRNPENFTEND
jgi:predicted GNAT superfamily acetyltransferase